MSRYYLVRHILIDLQDNFYRFRIASWKFVALQNKEEIKRIRERSLSYKSNVEESFKQYELFISDPKDREMYTKEKNNVCSICNSCR